MKPEPLKGKGKEPCNPEFFPEDTFFMKKNVKSAVEWLKERDKSKVLNIHPDFKVYVFTKDDFHKAFKDAMG